METKTYEKELRDLGIAITEWLERSPTVRLMVPAAVVRELGRSAEALMRGKKVK